MENIIPPVDRKLLLEELAETKLLRKSNFGNTELYIFTHEDSPNLMRELGRVRELTFRAAGGGIGKSIDLDAYDLSDNPYLQLIVWDSDEQEIIGGYRFIHGGTVIENPDEYLATSKLFQFSDDFIKNYLPYTIELGRSFVQPKYQQGRYARKGMFALDNLWDGLGALTIEYPDARYFFGKVTMYKHFDIEARNTLLSFMHLYFPDNDNLILTPSQITIDFPKYQKQFKGNDYKSDYKILSSVLKSVGEKIPPLINTYMNISPSMRTFGTVENPYFGGVEETGILISIDDIYTAKKDRHIITYKSMAQFTSLVKSKLKIKRIIKKSKK